MLTNLAQFYAVLATTRRYKWEANFNYIRGTIRVSGANREVCPVTAVYRKLTGKFISSTDFQTAAKKLGIRKRDAHRIAEAADNFQVYNRTRAKLLNAVGLNTKK